ncbi:MauE/DoxX family redox-associated membrane protein [Catellatospora vulcania]|uniref:MauE/DoxX family redox-associated membrane protein n=1 Tax=Catellatospora vulcania TaxID=1460450 RepID=UPI0018AF8644|nr:MauE/DoxX family redox-associated membrane protein [Catellatospora vulcania]
MEHLDIAVRCLLGIVFLAAATGKLRNRDRRREFAESVRAVGLLAGWAVAPAAMTVLAVELSVPALLAWPPTELLGYLLAAALLAAFCVAITAVLRHRRTVVCRCFGAEGSPLGRRHLVRNGLLLVLAAAGAAAAGSGGAVEPAGVVLAVAAAAVAAMVLIRFDDLADLFA